MYEYICKKVEFLRLNIGEGLIIRLFSSVSVSILIHPVVFYYIEYEWSIAAKHNTLIFVIQYDIFRFNETSSRVTVQKFVAPQHSALDGKY
jgi:hypothetical protein